MCESVARSCARVGYLAPQLAQKERKREGTGLRGKTEREENNYVSTQLPEVAMEICYCDSDGGVSESEV